MSGKSKKRTCVSTKRSKKVSTAIKKVQLKPLVDPWQPNPVDLATICINDNQNVSNSSISSSSGSYPISPPTGTSARNKINGRLPFCVKVEILDKCLKQISDGSPTPKYTELAKEYSITKQAVNGIYKNRMVIQKHRKINPTSSATVS